MRMNLKKQMSIEVALRIIALMKMRTTPLWQMHLIQSQFIMVTDLVALRTQLVVKDGLNSSNRSLFNKAGKLVNHIKKSTIAMGRVEKQNKKGIIPKNDTRWNSQLIMARRISKPNLEGVTDKKELQLSSHEKAILKSFVAIRNSHRSITGREIYIR